MALADDVNNNNHYNQVMYIGRRERGREVKERYQFELKDNSGWD